MNRNIGKGVYLFLAAVLAVGLALVAGPTPAMADSAVQTRAKVTIHEQPDGGACRGRQHRGLCDFRQPELLLCQHHERS